MKMVTRYIPIVIMVLLVAALSTSTVLADPGHKGGHKGDNGGGKGNGGNNNTDSTGTLIADPDPALTDSPVRIKGCGFSTDFGAELRVIHATYTEASGAWVWANGCIDMPWRTAEAGTYQLEAYQKSKGNKISLVSTGSLTVEGR